MKIARLNLAGFRGAQGSVSLEVPLGFMVVSGRNGSGKSTICDAIEFALTGDIRSSTDHREKGEGILDYIWWRGDSEPQERYVELTLIDTDGTTVTVRRSPDGFTVEPQIDLETFLCNASASLDRPLNQLCRTAILRDEEITRLSIDLKEVDRFDFVRSALGTADFTDVERRTKDVHDLLINELRSAEQAYSAATNNASRLATRLTEARTEIASHEEIADADALLRGTLGEAIVPMDELIRRAERHLADDRISGDAIARLYARARSWDDKRKELAQADRMREIVALTEQIEAASRTLNDYTTEASAARDELGKVEEQSSPTTASLAALHEHGTRVGLVEGCCPLCGEPHSEEQFQERLEALNARVTSMNAKLAELTKTSTEGTAKVSKAQADLRNLEGRLSALKEQSVELDAERDAIAGEIESLGVENWNKDEPNLALIAGKLESSRERTRRLEHALAVIHASRAVDEVTSLEGELKSAREEVTKADKRTGRVKSAVAQMKEALDTVRRVRGEYVNEQLAQLEPLLIELYQRLRPHIDWPEVRYRLRGDVRRMLRLEIGEGLNPSFLFSSGQRRAAGLAFLLAVHLSRSWCALKTLVLDDPVQHIDDYRALHLTEVLAAIRRTGQQVICTVEDESLAGLLARRLGGTDAAGGSIVRMAYSPRNGIEIESANPVHRLREHVLVSA